MGPLAKFLLALTNLVRSGGIKKIPDAIKFAEQQFGKVTPLLKKQIQNENFTTQIRRKAKTYFISRKKCFRKY